ncbi:hypothetical protein SAMN04489712_103399 [Thermomonospora echinospora]|uniref:Uncharacterized protein n=1 Tax=Thermomonospora echinospora TaxID=1992 RepID=A0A1H5XT23_9ACTN|nr:hypothetical protein [Thermomonospora echinospora]SEG14949.1 hypothetical protein SAMN04489712_103399 [Thermomonospora echinospora]
MTDAELLRLVRTAFQVHDPPPESVPAAARAAFRLREPDAALAGLVRDGDDEALPALRGDGTRLLVFAGGGLTVEVEVTGGEQVYQIAGQLLPPAHARVRVRHTDGELDGRAGPAGQFVVDGVPAGLISLLFRLPDDSSVVTSWIRL